MSASAAMIALATTDEQRSEIEALRARVKALEEHHRYTVELSPQVFWTANAQGEVDQASPRWFDLVGYTPEQALGYGWTRAVHPDDLPHAFAQWAICLKTGEPLDIDYRWRMIGGEYRWFRAFAQSTRGPDGQIARWYGTSENIHERKIASIALQDSESRLRFALESGKLGTWEIDLATGRLLASDQCAADFGWTGGASLTSYGEILAAIHPEDRRSHRATAAAFRRTHGYLKTEFRVVWPDGSLHWVRITGRIIPGEDGIARRAVGTSHDITDRQHAEEIRQRAEARMVYLANYDELTGLANTRLLQFTLESWFAPVSSNTDGNTDGNADGNPAANPVNAALFSIDLNDFKSINDTLGQTAGDALLREFARRLQSIAEPAWVVARGSGSEFTILAKNRLNRAEATIIAEKILRAAAEPIYLGDRMISLGASIGISLAPEHTSDGEQLRKNAATALWRCRNQGRDQFQFFEPEMDLRHQAREVLKLELQDAIGRHELRLHYQPIVDLRTGRIISFEALMRWQHRTRGMVSPADFIPLAEETGWIVGFGRWALAEACREAATWPAAISVAVNLSIVQFDSGTLEADVAAALSASGLDPGRLELEVTESLLLRHTDENIGLLNRLRAMGVRLSMDDFGTGYASLSSLRGFKFDKIKLDKSLIDGVPDAGEGDAIVEGVIGLTRGLRLPITAEGVETQAQFSYLRDQGYSHAQGYFVSKPVTGAQIPALLAQSWTT